MDAGGRRSSLPPPRARLMATRPPCCSVRSSCWRYAAGADYAVHPRCSSSYPARRSPRAPRARAHALRRARRPRARSGSVVLYSRDRVGAPPPGGRPAAATPAAYGSPFPCRARSHHSQPSPGRGRTRREIIRRNFGASDREVGLIRRPLRAIALPDPSIEDEADGHGSVRDPRGGRAPVPVAGSSRGPSPTRAADARCVGAGIAPPWRGTRDRSCRRFRCSRTHRAFTAACSFRSSCWRYASGAVRAVNPRTSSSAC